MARKENIKIVVVNKPSKEESRQKIKELCAFLEKVWTFPPKDK